MEKYENQFANFEFHRTASNDDKDKRYSMYPDYGSTAFTEKLQQSPSVPNFKKK